MKFKQSELSQRGCHVKKQIIYPIRLLKSYNKRIFFLIRALLSIRKLDINKLCLISRYVLSVKYPIGFIYLPQHAANRVRTLLRQFSYLTLH